MVWNIAYSEEREGLQLGTARWDSMHILRESLIFCPRSRIAKMVNTVTAWPLPRPKNQSWPSLDLREVASTKIWHLNIHQKGTKEKQIQRNKRPVNQIRELLKFLSKGQSEIITNKMVF